MTDVSRLAYPRAETNVASLGEDETAAKAILLDVEHELLRVSFVRISADVIAQLARPQHTLAKAPVRREIVSLLFQVLLCRIVKIRSPARAEGEAEDIKEALPAALVIN